MHHHHDVIFDHHVHVDHNDAVTHDHDNHPRHHHDRNGSVIYHPAPGVVDIHNVTDRPHDIGCGGHDIDRRTTRTTTTDRPRHNTTADTRGHTPGYRG